MEERLANATKIHVGDWIERLQPFENAGKGFFAHATDGLFPGITEAGNTVQVTSDRGFNINLGQMRHWPVHTNEILTLVQTNFSAWFQPILCNEVWRYHQTSLFIDFRPGGSRFDGENVWPDHFGSEDLCTYVHGYIVSCSAYETL